MAVGAIERLGRLATLGAADVAALEDALADRKAYPARTDLVKEGYPAHGALVLLSGWAGQYKATRMGIRQITCVLMPGDLDLLDALTPDVLDYSVCALTAVTVARIPKDKARRLARDHPAILEAVLRLQRMSETQLRDTVLNVSRRTAMDRLATQLLALWSRASDAGLIQNDQLALPLSQGDLADTVGLTPVHLNRTLQKLRATGLVVLRNGILRIPDPAALARLAGCGLPVSRLKLVA